MGVKLHDHGSGQWAFHCPGCGNTHIVPVPRWTWNGSVDKPTFTPSLLLNKGHAQSRCHSIITDGRIAFCGDSYHSLAGKTVDIPDWDEEDKMGFDFGKQSAAKTPAPTTARKGSFDFGGSGKAGTAVVDDDPRPLCPKNAAHGKMSTGGVTDLVCLVAGCAATMSRTEADRRFVAGMK